MSNRKLYILLSVLMIAVVSAIAYFYYSKQLEEKNLETKSIPEAVFSEGYIEVLGPRVDGWAFDQSKPLHVYLEFTSEQNPKKKFSISFYNIKDQGKNIIWRERGDVDALIIEKEPNLKGVPMKNEFLAVLDFPDGNYT